MRIGLHERILHGFVGFGGITQIVPGDPRGPALLAGDDLREQLARRMVVAGRGGILHLCRQDRFDLGRCARLPEQRSQQPSRDRAYSWIRLCWPFIYKWLRGSGLSDRCIR